MANKKEPTPGTIGWRAEQLRLALDLNHERFAERLADVAGRWGFTEGGKWTDSRVSRLLLNRKPAALSDVAVLVLLAREAGLERFDWDYLVMGEERSVPNLGSKTLRPVGKGASKKAAAK